MSRSADTQPSIDRARATSTQRTVVINVMRRTLLVLCVAAACYLAYGFGQLWAEWREARQPAPTHSAETALTSSSALNPMATAVALSGQWSFGDIDGNLKSSIVDMNAIPERFEALAKTSFAPDISQLPDIGPEILEMAAMVHLQPEERGADRIYHLDRPDLKVELIARNVDGHEKAVAIACAYPQSGSHWQLFELTPGEAAHKSDRETTHLLPVPADVSRSAGRFADDGSLLLELLTLNSSSDALTDSWRKAGWEVRPSGIGDPGGFSFLCGHGNEVIYAWSPDPLDSLKTVMLVRSPTDEELRALQSIPKREEN